MSVFDEISAARKNLKHDLHILVGQLNSVTHEPVDSFTLFEYMQRNHIPCRFVLWKKHPWYISKKLYENSDVIALDGDGVSDQEFAYKCRNELARAKSVCQEIAAINIDVKKFLKDCADLKYVFLAHGIFQNHWLPSYEKVLSQFNYINVSSLSEQIYIQSKLSNQFFGQYSELPFVVGGLPRLDKLQASKRDDWRKTIFIMPTYRASFGRHDLKYFYRSEYYSNLKSLLSKDFINLLMSHNVRVVLCPHHHLKNTLNGMRLDFGNVEIADTTEVSHWIRNSDMCITDFSSVSFDFLFQHKPVVYWQLDVNDRQLDKDDQQKVQCARRDLLERFNVVFDITALKETVMKYVENGFDLEPEYAAEADRFFQRRTGICESLTSWLQK